MADFIRENWYYFAAGAGTLLALLISLCCINHFELRAINRLQAKRNLMRVCWVVVESSSDRFIALHVRSGENDLGAKKHWTRNYRVLNWHLLQGNVGN